MLNQAQWLLNVFFFFFFGGVGSGVDLNEITVREGPEKQTLSRMYSRKGLSRKNGPGAEAAELCGHRQGPEGRSTRVVPGPVDKGQCHLGQFTDLGWPQFFHL